MRALCTHSAHEKSGAAASQRLLLSLAKAESKMKKQGTWSGSISFDLADFSESGVDGEAPISFSDFVPRSTWAAGTSPRQMSARLLHCIEGTYMCSESI